jgi:uncharacterized membrane protein YfcA
MFWLLLSAFGVLAGMTTVLFGFGGGFVAVPLLYSLILAAYPPESAVSQSAMHIAVATSTAAMIFGAGLATLRRHRAGQLQWSLVRPLLGPIAIGAMLGAFAATWVSGSWIRGIFIAYLGLTILDSILRPGFMNESTGTIRPLGRRSSQVIGLGIGAIAAFLGVGGSVLSVPMMRRRGAAMSEAAALANPLSLPSAIAGSLVYTVLAFRGEALGSGFLGYVDLLALVILVAGSWCGIRLGATLVGRIPDDIHAKAYLSLLALMMAVMVMV